MTGEREDLEPWIDPFVPVAGPVHMDASGWGQIDGLGAWDCALTGFHAMEEVPWVHK